MSGGLLTKSLLPRFFIFDFPMEYIAKSHQLTEHKLLLQ